RAPRTELGAARAYRRSDRRRADRPGPADPAPAVLDPDPADHPGPAGLLSPAAPGPADLAGLIYLAVPVCPADRRDWPARARACAPAATRLRARDAAPDRPPDCACRPAVPVRAM